MVDKYDCSFNFDDPKERKKYKYLVVYPGDLDSNGCMMLKTKKCIKEYLKERKECLSEAPYCVIEIGKFL